MSLPLRKRALPVPDQMPPIQLVLLLLLPEASKVPPVLMMLPKDELAHRHCSLPKMTKAESP